MHASVGLFVAGTPYVFTSPAPVYVLAVGFVTLNALALRRSWWRGIHGREARSWGTVAFPLVLIPALAVTWSLDPSRSVAFQVAFLVLAMADPVAAWVGGGQSDAIQYELGGSTKTIAGSVAFGLVSWIVSTGALIGFWQAGVLDWNVAACVGAGLIVALTTTTVEALCGRGWDNFFIVIAVLVILIPLIDQPTTWPILLGGFAGGCVFATATYWIRALDASGAVAGGLFAASLIGWGGWAWAVPGFTFFILSSGLSRVGRPLKSGMAQRSEKGHIRDAGQVYANGAIAWGSLLIYVAWPSAGLYVSFLGALAAAAADTWATELGALSPRRPRSLRTGRRVPRGTSGALSVTGTFAAVAGAATVAVSAAPFWESLVEAIAPTIGVALVIGSGIVGAMSDSVAGATLQAQYRDARTGALMEQTDSAQEHYDVVRGWPSVTNDHVNWIGTAMGAAVAVVSVAVLG